MSDTQEHSNDGPERASMNYGRFFIPRHAIRGDLSGVKAIMRHMVVTRAEMHFDLDGIVYSAMSDLFDPVPEICEIPFYRFSMRTTGLGEKYLDEVVKVDPSLVPQF